MISGTFNKNKRTELNGEPISSGYALGKAFVYKDILTREIIEYNIKENEIESEIQRINESIQNVTSDMEKMRSTVENDIDSDHAGIFEMHKMILNESELIRELEEEVRTNLVNAEQVVKNVFSRRIFRLKSSDNEMVRSKAADIEDIHRRLLRSLMGYNKNVLEQIEPNSIVVARRLLPSDTVHMKRKNVSGIIVEEGSSYSHSAILSKALGIPAVLGIPDILNKIKTNDEILIDGNSGLVIIRPDTDDRERYFKTIKVYEQNICQEQKKAKEPAVMKNGLIITVSANIMSEDDYDVALENGCDGVGLWRIEEIYLRSKIFPDEMYLKRHFTDVLQKSPDTQVTVRLLDIGGDKKLPYIDLGHGLDSFLGLRGIRMLLKYENMLITQLNVVSSLSASFNLRILVPMVTFAKEMIKVRELYNECLKSNHESAKKKMLIGAMIETPAAVINLPEILEYSDFISIGTNDLIQYTMAAGRENAGVSEYYKEGAHVIMGMIKSISSLAHEKNKECSICGEIAGDLSMTEVLLKTGITHLSVSPHIIPGLKEKIRNFKE